MKVLYLCTDGIDLAAKSGGAIHMRSFVRALGEIGHEVAVVSTSASSPESLETDLHAGVFPAPRTSWNHALSHAIAAGNRALGRPTRHNPDAVRVLHNSTFLKVATEVARRLNPDFIYERYTLWGLAGLRLAQARAIPLILEVNAPLAYEQERFRAGLTCPPFARWMERRIWRKADLVVAVSEALRSRLVQAGVRPERIRTLPNAVDTRRFHPGVSREPVRSELHLDGQFVVGFVASFKKWHGADLLIQAFRDLHAIDNSTHLLLVGDGPLRPLAEAEVRQAGLEKAVTFAGSVAHDDVPRYVAAMDVAVAPYPALNEFYYSPLKLFEYMAAGRAVVASRVGQVAEIVADGVTGLLFEPGDRAGLLACIRHLHESAALREEVGRRASRACSNRTWAANAAQVVEWAETLLGRPASAGPAPIHPAVTGSLRKAIRTDIRPFPSSSQGAGPE